MLSYAPVAQVRELTFGSVLFTTFWVHWMWQQFTPSAKLLGKNMLMGCQLLFQEVMCSGLCWSSGTMADVCFSDQCFGVFAPIQKVRVTLGLGALRRQKSGKHCPDPLLKSLRVSTSIPFLQSFVFLYSILRRHHPFSSHFISIFSLAILLKVTFSCGVLKCSQPRLASRPD